MKYDIKRLERLPERIAALEKEVHVYGNQLTGIRDGLDKTNSALAVLERQAAKDSGVSAWTNRLVFLAVVALAGMGWWTAVSINAQHSEIVAPRAEGRVQR